MFLFNNRMLCIQNVWKKSHLTPAWMEGGVGSQLCEFPSEQACAARSIDLHSLKVSHLCFPLLRLPAECLLLAHVPSEDSEWSRDGSCPDFSQGISLFVQILLATAPSLQSTKLRAGVS